MVKLDEKTGKMDWFYQQTPHNIYDWDFQNPPVLVNAGGRDLAIGSGKSGVVVALDAKSGKPVWKRPVGTHNGHDNDPIYAMKGEYSKIKTGEVFPGQLGGVIAPLASDGKSVFVPIVNHSMTVVSGSEVTESSAGTGELVALDLASGKVEWKKKLPQPAYGAPTVVNDLVFQTTFDGIVYALDTKSGGEVWQATLPAGTNAGVVGQRRIPDCPRGPADGRRPGRRTRRLPPRRLGGLGGRSAGRQLEAGQRGDRRPPLFAAGGEASGAGRLHLERWPQAPLADLDQLPASPARRSAVGFG